MAEEATQKQKVIDRTNWADMDNDDEDDQEIGVQGSQIEEKKENSGAAEVSHVQSVSAEGGEKSYPRKKKDYGSDYNPNYKKTQWRKGPLTEEQKKNFQPPVPRTKTERGDYVVTSFSIPDRVAAAKAAAEKVSHDYHCLFRVKSYGVFCM